MVRKFPTIHASEIVINSIKNNDKINIEIVNYLNTINYYIRELLDYINKNYSHHENYKDLVICIIRLNPELIKTINIDLKRDFGDKDPYDVYYNYYNY